MSSGRAAMSIALAAMAAASRTSRTNVVVPAYTCYSVPAAVRRAGLRPVFCDVDPATLSLDMDHLRGIDFGNVLAVVSANLYGIPNDNVSIAALARERGAFMLDDAAQALGAGLAGHPVGGFGDAGLYSFDRGKNITTVQGGAIVTSDPCLGAEIERVRRDLPPPRYRDTLKLACQLPAYSLFLRPVAYVFVRRLPFLALGTTAYEEQFPVAGYSRLLSGVALRLCQRLGQINGTRVSNAEALCRELRDAPRVRLIQLVGGAQPVYTRFPLRVLNQDDRAQLLQLLDRDGIGASASFPMALIDLPQMREFVDLRFGYPGAREVANTILTLPTHAYCPADLPARVRRAIEAVALGRDRQGV
jgi:dTDP-4-amino-4,6-dideoxygalactose transaminase